MRFLALLLLLLPLTARADWWDFSIYSKHFRAAENSWNIGLQREHQISENVRVFAGFYDDTHRELSLDAGLTYAPLRFGRWHVGVLGGAVTGYRDNPLTPIPLGGFVAAYERERDGLNLVVIPFSGGLVNFSYKILY